MRSTCRRSITSRPNEPVQQVAVHGGQVLAVMGGKLYRLVDDQLQLEPPPTTDIRLLKSVAGRLWLSGQAGVFEWTAEGWQQRSDLPAVDLCWHLGHIHLATRDEVYRLVDGQWQNLRPAEGYLSSDSTVVMEDFSQVLADPVRIGPIQRIASYSGTLYLLGPHRLSLLEGNTFVPDPIDWGVLPGNRALDMLAHGSRLFVTTNRGLAVLRGMALETWDGSNRFPIEETTCLAAGFAGDTWMGTTSGAIRAVNGEFHYFGAQHWLPADGVNAITVADRQVVVATNGGLGIISYRPYTLQKKADYFRAPTDRWGHRRMGFVHKLSLERSAPAVVARNQRQ